MLESCDKIMHLRFNVDACPMHSPFGFVHLTHQNLSARALFCHNSLPKVNTQLLIYNSRWSILRNNLNFYTYISTINNILVKLACVQMIVKWFLWIKTFKILF